jgi:hypothetical protein
MARVLFKLNKGDKGDKESIWSHRNFDDLMTRELPSFNFDDLMTRELPSFNFDDLMTRELPSFASLCFSVKSKKSK